MSTESANFAPTFPPAAAAVASRVVTPIFPPVRICHTVPSVFFAGAPAGALIGAWFGPVATPAPLS